MPSGADRILPAGILLAVGSPQTRAAFLSPVPVQTTAPGCWREETHTQPGPLIQRIPPEASSSRLHKELGDQANQDLKEQNPGRQAAPGVCHTLGQLVLAQLVLLCIHRRKPKP